MKTAKKGFTLIELMVVIVIIGILAAIAIPKLFGMTAKAKASEVGGTAGTWVKLENAFQAETGVWGSFAAIGYTPPGASDAKVSSGTTAFFKYESVTLTGIETLPKNWGSADTSSTSVGFKATSQSALGDCKSGAIWELAFEDGDIIPTATIDENESDEGTCETLTPNFIKLGKPEEDQE